MPPKGLKNIIKMSTFINKMIKLYDSPNTCNPLKERLQCVDDCN